jgi:hypothetical protein
MLLRKDDGWGIPALNLQVPVWFWNVVPLGGLRPALAGQQQQVAEGCLQSGLFDPPGGGLEVDRIVTRGRPGVGWGDVRLDGSFV